MRLDRYLSQVTPLSRSDARSAIRAGRVHVDGVSMLCPAYQVDPGVEVIFDGQPLETPAPRYYMLNKPAGVVCASRDPSHRTVLALFDLVRPDRLHVAGRLDIDATGLVLVTDDGQWSHRITSPVKACGKTYLVTLKHELSDTAALQIEQGVVLHNEEKPTRPASLQKLDETHFRLSITEGRYHQVKRMFAAVGNRVVALHRLSIGPLVLDEQLAAGAYRPLTPDEINAF
jgi:16S rRNA pseudouridine516 synthase